MIETTDQTNFLSLITPSHLAIVWPSHHSLDSFPKFFTEIDYLLDGQLKRFVNEGKNQKDPDEVCLFVNKHFNSDLYVLYIKLTKEQKSKDLIAQLSPLIDIAKKARPERQNIVVIDENHKNNCEEIMSHLKKTFPSGLHNLIRC